VKRYTIKVDRIHLPQAFRPVRTKKDVVDLLMNTIKLFTQRESLAPREPALEIVLYVDKCSRLFYHMKSKYFSINFPFEVKDVKGELHFSSNGYRLDSFLTSRLLEVFLSPNFGSECETGFIDSVWRAGRGMEYFWPLVQKLMTFEDAYIRFDIDEKRANGRLHPTNHIDLFYAKSSFKVGLSNRISTDSFRDLLDQNTDCHYLDSE